jgi:hypothetical protein
MSKTRTLAGLVSNGNPLADGTISPSEIGAATSSDILRISGVTYPGDDLAVNPAGGQTVTISGSGFTSTPTIYVGGTIAPSVTFVSATQLTFTTPVKTSGTYDIYVVNPNGATAIRVYGISYSGVPTWSTAAGDLGTLESNWTIQLQATSNSSVTYALTSGSTLPSGVTLNSTGLITGTSISVEQTFNFSVTAIDLENQDTPRSFSITITLGEPYFKYTTLLLTGNGTNAAQNNTFLDSGPSNITLTRNGIVSQGSFSPYGKNWSNYFNGSTDYLRIASNSAFALPGDFTLEMWMYPLNWAASNMLPYATYPGQAGGLMIGKIGSEFVVRASDTANQLTFPSFPATNQWTHVAVVRSGSTLSGYFNGTRVVTTTNTFSFTQSALSIGSEGQGSNYSGYLSNVRLVKNTAVYDPTLSTLIVPVTPLTAISGTSVLTCQSNRFIDTSTNNFTFTLTGTPGVNKLSPFNLEYEYSTAVYGGSAYFTPTNSSGLNAGTTLFNSMPSAFTMEAWIYPLSYGGSASQYQNRPIMAKGVVYMNFGLTSSGALQLYHYEGNAQRTNASTTIVPLNAWSHVVASVSAGTITFYINGQSSGTATWYGISGNNTADFIGYHSEGSGSFNFFDGYLSDVRYAKSVIYSSNFTPPAVPISAVSTTAFLLSGTNAAIFDSTTMNNLETQGNSQISTSVVKYGTGSLYFDGNNDRLYIPAKPPLNITGDFTIEMWVYMLSLGSYNVLLDISSNGTAGSSMTEIWIESNGSAAYYARGSILMTTASSLITTNTWYHIAVVKSGTSQVLYINGTNRASTTSSTQPNVDFPYSIGDRPASAVSGQYPVNGYIDDFRITNGYARYTANFTPPTAAFKAR